MYLKCYSVILIFIMVLSFTKPSYSQFISLSSSFIDPSSSPLIIYDKIFPRSVIYQNSIMFAPAVDYINFLGINADLQKLPSQLILDNKKAPLSLLAIGPDRYTGQSIYYLNVMDTLNFLGIKYNVSEINGQKRIYVITSAGEVSKGGFITGQVMISMPFQKGTVTLLFEYVNDARIPSTKEITSIPLEKDGKFSFADLSPGKYTVRANSYLEESSYYFSKSTGIYYINTKITETLWMEGTYIYKNEHVNLVLKNGKTTFREIHNAVNPYAVPTGYPVRPLP